MDGYWGVFLRKSLLLTRLPIYLKTKNWSLFSEGWTLFHPNSRVFGTLSQQGKAFENSD